MTPPCSAVRAGHTLSGMPNRTSNLFAAAAFFTAIAAVYVPVAMWERVTSDQHLMLVVIGLLIGLIAAACAVGAALTRKR